MNYPPSNDSDRTMCFSDEVATMRFRSMRFSFFHDAEFNYFPLAHTPSNLLRVMPHGGCLVYADILRGAVVG